MGNRIEKNRYKCPFLYSRRNLPGRTWASFFVHLGMRLSIDSVIIHHDELSVFLHLERQTEDLVRLIAPSVFTLDSSGQIFLLRGGGGG